MKIHFIGIGGIGLSGIARVLQSYGHTISGSDISETSLTKKLQKEGIIVTIPHQKEAIYDQDLIIYSAVIKESNPEMQEARKRGIKTLSRREALSLVVSDKRVFSVCGAHGKSTTSAMLSSILHESNALIGAESKAFGSNARINSESELLTFESDESDGSFVDSNPFVAIVTNTEPEHMDFYNYDLDLFYDHYRRFLEKATVRVINNEDPFLKTLDIDAVRVCKEDAKHIRYEIINEVPKTLFEYDGHTFEVYGMGEHIVVDALLAIEAARSELSLAEIATNLKNYKGIKKRFDFLKNDTMTIIDDYGHHPTEIKATLDSVFRFAKLKGVNRTIGVWQPHKYSRTIDNLDAFKACFQGVDELIILPVWSAGEEVKAIDFERKFSEYTPTFADKVRRNKDTLEVIKEDEVIKVYREDLVIGFGAGDVTYQLRTTDAS